MNYSDIEILVQNDESKTVEFKKTTGELKDAMRSACAFLNTNGGLLVFGVSPKPLKIVGQEVSDSTKREISQALSSIEPIVDVVVEYVEIPNEIKNQVIVMRFEPWVNGKKPYVCNGRPYYRLESTTRVMPQALFEERLKSSDPLKFAWENQIASEFTLSDLDEEMIRGAVRAGIDSGRLPATAINETMESILQRWHLMDDEKLYNSAVALFAKDIKNYSQLMVRMACFKDTDKLVFLDSKVVEGNIFKLFSESIEFLFKHLNLYGEVKGEKRVEQLEIPIEALREALINALCHRIYDDYRESISLAIYADRVEISNPGKLPYPLTVENIHLPHESKPHNVKIAQVLYKVSYLESWGTGFQRMQEFCKMQGLQVPQLEVKENRIVITFVRENVNGQLNGQLNESQRETFNYVKMHEGCNTTMISEGLGKPFRTVDKHILFLLKYGYIERRGSKKNGGFYVKQFVN